MRLLVMAVGCLLTLGACGDASDTEKAAPRQTATAASPSPTFDSAACAAQLGEFVDELNELNSRLDIGLNYDEYTNRVGGIKVVYDRVSFDAVDIECTERVGLDAEAALNRYIKAAGIWGDCFDDIDCSTDSIEPKLQRHWSKASELLDGLESLD